MSCERFDVALKDGALGATMAPDVQSHVTECPRCRAAFADYHRAVVQLDTDLQAALSVEPSLGFQARIRRRVEDAHASARRPLGWIAAAATAAVVVVVIALLVGQNSRRALESQFGGTTAAGPRPAEAPQQNRQRVTDSSSAAAQPGRAARFHVVRARVNRPRPEVLVPRARVEDLQRFLTSVNDGLFHLPAGVDLPAAIGFGDGDVQPLLISPIPVAPVEVQQTPVQAIRDVDKGADRD